MAIVFAITALAAMIFV